MKQPIVAPIAAPRVESGAKLVAKTWQTSNGEKIVKMAAPKRTTLQKAMGRETQSRTQFNLIGKPLTEWPYESDSPGSIK